MSAKKYYLVSPDRAKELKKAGNALIREILAVQSKFGIMLHCSGDTNVVEIYDPNSALPKGYEYVALLSIDDGFCSFEVCELIDEDREVADEA